MQRVRLQNQEEFPCAETARLNNDVAFDMMPLANSSWSTAASWVSKFLAFAVRVSRQAGKFYTDRQLLASDNMCRHFIVHVAKEDKGYTRPRSARAALSAERIRQGFASLTPNKDIAAVVKFAEASAPRTKKQAAGLTAIMLQFIRRNWGRHRSWWQRQNAAIFALGFVTLMRLGEIRNLSVDGIRVVYQDGSEIDLKQCRVLPSAARVAGLLMHLPWRKNHVANDCWVPVACKQVIALVLRQVNTLRDHGRRSGYLFPSRKFKSGGRQAMNKNNRVGHDAVVKALREALMECVPTMTEAWAGLYSGHSLRVGGSNEMRRRGVADEVHRKLGGWMSLVSAQGYMSLSAAEQFKYTLKLAKKGKRRAAHTRDSARRALQCLAREEL